MEKTILLMGDSLSKGIVLDEDQNRYTVLPDNFFSLLSQSVNARMINASRFGSTVVQGQRWLEIKM